MDDCLSQEASLNQQNSSDCPSSTHTSLMASPGSHDILKGCDLSKTTVILDRKEAITSAINELRENSVLLVLGKGHEMYQEINNSHIPFNDNDFINKTIGGLI